ALQGFGAASSLIAPLTSSGRSLGVMCLLAKAEDAFQSSDLCLWLSLARIAAAAIENGSRFREMAAARDRAEASSRAKDEFLAILSHELRNPLMPVMGWARIFKSHEEIASDPALREGAESLERNAADIARLVDDCLDLARISQGKIHMDRQEVDL